MYDGKMRFLLYYKALAFFGAIVQGFYKDQSSMEFYLKIVIF